MHTFSIPESNEIEDLYKAFKSSLPDYFYDREWRMLLNEFQEEHSLSGKKRRQIAKLLREDKKKITIKWPEHSSKFKTELYSFLPSFDPVLFGRCFVKKGYFSHFTALFFNGLTQQIPSSYFISKEIKGRKGQRSKQIEDFELEQIFRKEPRSTKNYASYKGKKFYVIEKEDISRVGVSEYVYNSSKDIDMKRSIFVTDLERTLIDSVMAPQYSGGIGRVYKAFQEGITNISIDKLYQYYKTIDPYYPYWQCIGFFIEKLDSEMAESWSHKFEAPDLDFYLVKGYRSTWVYDKKWRVYIPEGYK